MGPVRKILTNKYFATVLTLVLSFGLMSVGYDSIWPLFGSANQLLSVLALIACAVFLKRSKKIHAFLYIPLGLMVAVTFTALSVTIYQKLSALINATSTNYFGDGLQMVFAVLILGLGVCVVVQGVRRLIAKNPELTEAEKMLQEAKEAKA